MMCLGMYNKWVKIFNVSPDFFLPVLRWGTVGKISHFPDMIFFSSRWEPSLGVTGSIRRDYKVFSIMSEKLSIFPTVWWPKKRRWTKSESLSPSLNFPFRNSRISWPIKMGWQISSLSRLELLLLLPNKCIIIIIMIFEIGQISLVRPSNWWPNVLKAILPQNITRVVVKNIPATLVLSTTLTLQALCTLIQEETLSKFINFLK